MLKVDWDCVERFQLLTAINPQMVTCRQICVLFSQTVDLEVYRAIREMTIDRIMMTPMTPIMIC
jgi:hypothetical protein